MVVHTQWAPRVSSFGSRSTYQVVKYDKLIHEFDPYFNYRATVEFAEHGMYAFWNWFDTRSWYPLGRHVGGTVYPGLMFTAGTAWNILQNLGINVDVMDVCVFTAPAFAAAMALSTYFFTKEIKGSGAGLAAAMFASIVPSYISRSVAGSYDNEGIAIFALMLTFFLYVKTLNTGSLAWGTANAIAYFYMVCSWGGYSFIINLLPIHCLAMMISGRYTSKLYIAYAPLVILGTILACCVPVVGFNAVLTSEHFAAFLAFAVLQVVALLQWLKKLLPSKTFASMLYIILMTVGVGAALSVSALCAYILSSPTFGWTGRSLTLLDPTYASKYIPIIASVSEHQPTPWTSFFMDINLSITLLPAGLVACFRPLTDVSLFLVLYCLTAVYFSGVMVRLMLVLAPVACCLAGIALSSVCSALCESVQIQISESSNSSAPGEQDQRRDATAKKQDSSADSVSGKGKRRKPRSTEGVEATDRPSSQSPLSVKRSIPLDAALVTLGVMGLACASYIVHCVFTGSEMYSSPSIVLYNKMRDGSTYKFDDFRESYTWLKENTEEDCVVASWWDYGYQTAALANRTTVVDNNTWNNTHIATVGRAMSSSEKKGWNIFRSLDVDYVFVVFGGLIGYPSDDINKFLWMVRIGGDVYPEIQEKNYLSESGMYTIGEGASSTMVNSVIYKLSYYRFAEMSDQTGGMRAFDKVRRTAIAKPDVTLKYFEEVYSSTHWMVRIYKVKDEPNVDAKPSGMHHAGRNSLYL